MYNNMIAFPLTPRSCHVVPAEFLKTGVPVFLIYIISRVSEREREREREREGITIEHSSELRSSLTSLRSAGCTFAD